MEFIIRRADASDIENLVALRLEMRRERECVPLAMPEEEFAVRVKNFFEKAIAEGDFVSFIAWAGDEVAACSGLSVQMLPPSYGNPDGKIGYITNMYTRPAWRRQGLAVKLLDALKDYAGSVGCGKLVLNASDAGYPVYQKYGFADVKGEMSMKL